MSSSNTFVTQASLFADFAQNSIVINPVTGKPNLPYLTTDFRLKSALQAERSVRAGMPIDKMKAQALLEEIRKLKAAANNGLLQAGSWHLKAPALFTFIEWLNNGICH